MSLLDMVTFFIVFHLLLPLRYFSGSVLHKLVKVVHKIVVDLHLDKARSLPRSQRTFDAPYGNLIPRFNLSQLIQFSPRDTIIADQVSRDDDGSHILPSQVDACGLRYVLGERLSEPRLL